MPLDVGEGVFVVPLSSGPWAAAQERELDGSKPIAPHSTEPPFAVISALSRSQPKNAVSFALFSAEPYPPQSDIKRHAFKDVTFFAGSPAHHAHRPPLLLHYCEFDPAAMVMIWRHWAGMSERLYAAV